MNFGYFISSAKHKRLRLLAAPLAIAAMMSWFVLPGSVWDGLEPTLASSADTVIPGTTEEARVRDIYGKLPLFFEVNAGQKETRGRFLARGAGYSLLLADGEALLSLRKDRSGKSAPPNVLQMRLAGARKKSEISGEDEQTATSNYFIGSDPAKWRTGVGHYGKVRYREVYRGVDQVYYGNQGKLEYDLIVAPGADPKQIGLRFAGLKRVRIDEATGELVLKFGDGSEVRQQKPNVYQDVDGAKREIAGNYLLKGSHEVGFQIAGYDKHYPLVIDPTIGFSTVLGGSGDDRSRAIAIDSAGNSYVTGNTTSTNFPTTTPFQGTFGGGSISGDVFVLKLNPQGQVVYSTYLGGSGEDRGNGIAVDKSTGNVYVTGTTSSTNFPRANALQNTYGGGNDAFVTALNAAGSALVYSTYLGGSGQEQGTGIAIDASGNAYIAGVTASTNFPTKNPIQAALGATNAQNAFVTKLNPAGSALVYSTYLGGNFDTGNGIALDPSNNAYVVGQTFSAHFPTMNAYQNTLRGVGDGFVTKINAAGTALIYSTYLGGDDNETARGVAVDANGNAYVVGSTSSGNFPVVNPIQSQLLGNSNAFVTKLNSAGSALVYSTYLGGGGTDDGNGIAVDSSGTAFVVGSADSPNFPVVNTVQHLGGGGLFKSTNSGTNWSVSNDGLSSPSVSSIVVDPVSPSTIYLATRATSGGGFYKSTDGGVTWTTLNNGLSSYTIFGMAQDQTSPATFYLATQLGVFKTTDGGNDWAISSTGLPGSSFYPNLPGSDVNKLVIDPANASTIYAGSAASGVYKSTDGGNTWTVVNTGLTNKNINVLAVNPSATGTIYAGLGGFSATGVYKTTNGGVSWTNMSSGLPTSNAVNTLAFDPTNSNTIFAALNNGSGTTGGVYKSTDGGSTWTALVTTGFHILSLAVDPTNSSTIYAGTATHSGKGLLKSIDGGNTWTPSGLTNDSVAVLAIDKTNTAKIYAGDADTATDTFISVLDPSGSSLITSSFFGGTGTDFGQGIAVDNAGDAYIAGFSLSTDITIRSGSIASNLANDQTGDNNETIAPADPASGSVQAGEFADNFLGALLTMKLPCSITLTPSFPSGVVGQSYFGYFTPSGGDPPYKWPGGLGFPGVLGPLGGSFSGTPTVPGSFFATAQVTDSRDCSTIRSSSVTINPASQTVTLGTPNTGTVGPPTPPATAQLASPEGAVTISGGQISGGNGPDALPTQLRFDLTGDQNVDLYVRFGQIVTMDAQGNITADYSSTSSGGTESVTINSPQAGTYYAEVVNRSSSTANYTLTATTSNATPTPTPTPSPVTVGGKVLTPDGRGLRNTTVTMTDSQNNVRSATTSSFGFFSFDNVLTGSTYTFRVQSRSFRFSQQTTLITAATTLPDFVGLE